MRPLGHLVHPVHPGFINRIIRGRADHLEPRNRNSDTGESGRLNAIEQGPCGFIGLPGRLVRISFLIPCPRAVIIGVEMVAHVPAEAQGPGHFPGVVGAGCRVRNDRLSFLRDGKRDGGSACGRNRNIRLTGLVSVIGRNGQAPGNLVILVCAVFVCDPVRKSGFLRTGGRRNGQGKRLPCLGNSEGAAAQGDGCRSRRGRRGRILWIVPSTGGKNQRRGPKHKVSFHHFRDGIFSRVRTRSEDISRFQ